MTRLSLAFLCFAVLWAAAAPPAKSDDYSGGGITVSEPWARATPPAASTGALYATIRNSGDKPDRLIDIESDIAASGVVHEMSVKDGVMHMRPLTDGLVVPPGETVELAPGGFHAMLVGLKQPLQAGESFTATVVFEMAGRIGVAVPVVAMGAPAPAAHAMSGAAHSHEHGSHEGHHDMHMQESGGKP